MALADWNAYREALTGSGYLCHFRKAVTWGAGETMIGPSWNKVSYPPAGATPSTATALDYTGALGNQSIRHPAVGAGRLCLVGSDHLIASDQADAPFLLVDRLSHQGGLVGNSAVAQTTNLPTAALPRYADGAGVLIGMQVYSSLGSLGANPTTLTVSYTNQAGVAGRTGTFVHTQSFASDKFFVINFQPGDTGARSVESVTFSNATTSAGNWGIVLFKPLALVPITAHRATTEIVGWNTQIEGEAHLEAFGVSNQTGAVSGSLLFAEV